MKYYRSQKTGNIILDEEFAIKYCKKYFIKNAIEPFYWEDVIKIDPARHYTFGDVKKDENGKAIYPEGYMILAILNEKCRIKKGESADTIIIEMDKKVEMI
jgi:hypothetical protein